LKIKKGYILLAIIAIIIYNYNNYKKLKEKEFYTNILNQHITNIRHQDYFAIHSNLDGNLSKEISIEDIKKFTQAANIKKRDKIILNEINKDENKIELIGELVQENGKKDINFTIVKYENEFKVLSQKIGDNALKPSKVSFPIIENAKRAK